ncbi:thioredoxin-domain-containing protein [Mycena metata]|uniref:Thioredoxin-domain-containing protein n=1 Tax=Mycena metata TaxID=1033252 RepID=A0AAD7P308_9AGAR|nr:thioredoxin-domain-containing protein [Mycena metata]
MSITHLNSVSELNGHLSKSKDKISPLCGPCHAIAPTFESLSREYKNVNFFKCDVDAAKEVAEMYRVSAMPTFIFLKGSSKVDQVRGANPIVHATSASTSAFTGRGQTLGSGAKPLATLNKAASKVTNLDPQLRVLLGLVAGYAVFWYLSR